MTGDAGTNSQSFSYDNLDRLTGSTGLTASSTYAYDRDGNRVTRTDGAVTTTFNFDRTDELVNQSTNGGGSWTSFAFDAYGNTTTSVDKASATTTSAYDAADRLRSLTPPAGSTAASFTFDALGRIKTRVTGGNTDAYWYAGTSETAHQIVTTGSNPATLTSVIDPAGSRLTTSTGSLAYALPDLHGSTAGLENASRTLTAAYRYDGYGQTVATYPSVSPPVNPFRYRGLLDLSSDGSNPLYDMGARLYSPQLGAFTSLDSVRGNASDPASLNRFLYAEANPATLIDPDGHATYTGTLCGPYSDLCTVGGTLSTNPYSTTRDYASSSASSSTTYKAPTASVSPPLPGGRDNWREDVASGNWSMTPQQQGALDLRVKAAACRGDRFCLRQVAFEGLAANGPHLDPLTVLTTGIVVVGGVLLCLEVCPALLAGGLAFTAVGELGLGGAATVACAEACPAAGAAVEYGCSVATGTVCGTGATFGRVPEAAKPPGSLSGPVGFRAPPNATATEIAEVRAYCDACNRAQEAGALSPVGRVSTSGALRSLASRDAQIERLDALERGEPYAGHVGHAPDTTWTGSANPFEWIDLSPRVNWSLGGQAGAYPIGYAPTYFYFDFER